MEKQTKPIDRSKTSNRRCINCVHWKTATDVSSIEWDNRAQSLMEREKICHTAGDKGINYWNCCKHFQWDPEKEYTTPLPLTRAQLQNDAALEPLIGTEVKITAGRHRIQGQLLSITAYDLVLQTTDKLPKCKALFVEADGRVVVDRQSVESIEQCSQKTEGA